MNISVNASAAIADLNRFQTKALPYAAASALNGVALDAREELLAQMPGRFRFRTGTAWLRFHFKVEKATIQNLTAYFFVDLDYMKLHEFTGIKTPLKGPHLAVPLGALKLKKIPANLRPKYLLGNDLQGVLNAASLKTKSVRKRLLKTAAKGFIINSNGKIFIAIRNGAQVTILYTLVPAAKIGLDRLQMYETTARVVARNFAAKFKDRLNSLSLRFAQNA